MKFKNKLLGFLLATVIAPASLGLVACSGFGDKEASIESYEIKDYTRTYLDTDTFDVNGTLVLTMSDGTTKEITLTQDMLKETPDLSTVGEHTITYTYDGKEYVVKINVVESELTANKRIALAKLKASLLEYKNSSGKVSSIEATIGSSFIAKMLGLDAEGTDELFLGEIGVDQISSIDVLSKLMDAVINASLNDAKVSDVIFKQFENVDDKELLEYLKFSSIDKIKSTTNLLDIVNHFADSTTASQVYSSVVNQILLTNDAEAYATYLSNTIYNALSPYVEIEKENLNTICLSFVNKIKTLGDNSKFFEALDNINSYDSFVNTLILKKDSEDYAEFITDLMAENLGITEQARIDDLNSFFTRVINVIKSEASLKSLINGEMDIDYYDLIVNKFMLVKDTAYYAELLSNVASEKLEITDTDGKTELSELITSVLTSVRAGSIIDWQTNGEQLVNIVMQYSNSTPVQFVQYVEDCITNNELEQLVYEFLMLEPYVKIYDYGTADVVEVNNKKATMVENYENATKSLIHYIIYRDYETFIAEYPTYVDAFVSSRESLVKLIRNGSGYVVYDFYGLDDYDLDFIKDVFTRRYSPLISNFLDLNIGKNFAKDLVKCYKGELTTSQAMSNVIKSIQTYIKDNQAMMEDAICYAGNYLGLDMSKYIEQYKQDGVTTLIQDLVNQYLKAEEVVAYNQAQFGDNYNTFITAIDDLTACLDGFATKSVSEIYSQLTTSLKTIADLVSVEGSEIGEIGYAYTGAVATIPTGYIIMASDLLGNQLTATEKLQKYLPLVEDYVVEAISESIYANILGGRLITTGHYEQTGDGQWAYVVGYDYSTTEEYLATEALVSKYFQKYIDGEFVWSDAKQELIDLINDYAPNNIAIATGVLKDVDWTIYLNALKNGTIDQDTKNAVMGDVINLVNAYIEEYKENISNYAGNCIASILDIELTNAKACEDITAWVESYIDGYLTGEVNTGKLKADFETIITNYCDKQYSLAYDILDNITGELITDLNMAITKALNSYKQELLENGSEYLVENVLGYSMEDVNAGWITSKEYSKALQLARDFVDAVCGAYLEDNTSTDVVARKWMEFVINNPLSATDEKVRLTTFSLPVIIGSGFVTDYNALMEGLVDVRELSNGAITSIDYNKLVEEVFNAELFDNLLTIPTALVTNSVYENGKLVSETIEFTINMNYDAVVASLDADIKLSVTINY